MIYTDGTIAINAGSPIVTGTGTQWKKNIHGVAPGQLISIENGTAPVSMMIRAVNSDTELVLSFNAPVTLSGAKYAIATTVPDTISDAARTMSANQGYIVYFLQAMQQWMTSTGQVEIELPNGQKVTLEGIEAMNEAISEIASGNYATKTEVNSKLDKDQNGADIPDKEKFIGNLGLGEAAKSNVVQSTGASAKDVMSQEAVTDLAKATETPVGMFATFPHRATQLPQKWYSTNGDRFSVSSPQGLALKSLPAELKSDWGITESGGMINVPNIKQSDGRTPFLRPVNGTARQVGNVDGDKIRNISGQIRTWGSGANNGGAFTTVSTGTEALGGGTFAASIIVGFSSDQVVPTGPENKPLDIGVTLAIYLGV